MRGKSIFTDSTRESVALRWRGLFNLNARDLYPDVYTLEKCRELADLGLEILHWKQEKNSQIVSHYYLSPEFQEISDMTGDSLALSQFIQKSEAPRIDFQAVFFMAATAKIIAGDTKRIFVSDSPDVLGCSLVFGTDHAFIENWKKENPDGIVITYINSSVYTKSISNFISTSRNTHKIIAYAAKNFPGRKILVLPDKFLGFVMKSMALDLLEQEEIKIDPDLIEIYQQSFNGNNACCYVHEQLGPDAIEVKMTEYPEAVVLVHPECGCSSKCMYRILSGEIPHKKAHILSTEQMIQIASASEAKSFIVATEPGLIYTLRKRLPKKTFIPVSAQTHCRYMKGNTFEKLLRSLKEDRLEIILCDNCPKCVDPKLPYYDDRVIHIPREIGEKARLGIERMLTIV